MLKEKMKRDEKMTKMKNKKAKEQQEEFSLHNTESTNKAMYDLMINDHKKEFNIFNILSLAPSGLTLYDLIRITNITCEGLDFGNWSEFLTKIFTSEKVEISDTTNNVPVITKSQTLVMSKHDS